jgi:hypothetical protein
MGNMNVAILDVQFSPPDPRWNGIPGLRSDNGGWVFRLHDATGKKLVCGTARTGDDAITFAMHEARKRSFTHYRILHGDDSAQPVSLSHEKGWGI